MPVLSPHRSSASALTGSYRSTYSSSALDKPYYYSSSYSPRITTYSERYTARSYTDADGARIYSRSGSITEDGYTTRFKEESREPTLRSDSASRDSGISSIRENSILLDAPTRATLPSDTESVAEFRNRYSPANYVPACQRNREYVTRSRSINDIGLPPNDPSKRKVKNVYCDNGLANNTNGNDAHDDNGNARPTFSDIRKKFDGDQSGNVSKRTDTDGDSDSVNISAGKSKLNVSNESASEEDAGELGGGNSTAENEELNKNRRDVPSKEFHKGDSDTGYVAAVNGENEHPDVDEVEIMRGGHFYQPKNDVSASPRLNRNALPQAGTSASPSASSASNGRDSPYSERRKTREEDGEPDRSVGPAGVKQLGLNGLKNIGNTCFMNSVIQCLSNTRLLLEYVRRDAYVGDINGAVSSMKGSLIRAFGQVIKELWSEDALDRVVNTVALKSQIQRFAPRFMGYAQQDAQEFLRYLLEGLHEDVNRVTEKPKPILTEIDEKLSDSDKAAEAWRRYLRMDNSRIVDIFVGQLKSTLRCTHCGHCSVTFDPFWDLSLPIPQRTGQLRLSQCLDHFTKEETLDGDEKPTCSKCKERRRCTKSFSIQKFPKILVIHLKRFSPTERFRGKLSVTVDFPREGLDLRNYAADNPSECRYNLYAISNHSGTTYSGHYTAYCRHPYSLAWHEYNDSRVSSISSRSIVSGEAYVLFYELESQKSHL